MIPIVVAIWVANYRVYGAHKLWKAARRAGHDIGRDQVGRLMKAAGIEGVSRRRRKVRTTRADPSAPRPADLVERGGVAAGFRQAIDEARADRVGDIGEYNRYRAGHLQQRRQACRA